MTERKNHVCPVELSGSLDNRFRRWIQNPRKILSPLLKEGMTALDFGCGPGFFTLDMAHLVGPGGKVVAADLQPGMLAKLKRKIQGTKLADRILTHQCDADSIALSTPVDFALAFYMVHEIPDQERFFREISALLKTGGRLFIVEPLMHVSKGGFDRTINLAANQGLIPVARPKVFFSRAVVLQK